jgi:peroxiredoxin
VTAFRAVNSLEAIACHRPSLSGTAGVLAFAILLLTARPAPSSDDFPPGHSHRGEAFDHGPRHRAYLMGGTGKVHFPVSSRDPLVQKFIEQGIGQLHGFWFGEAERSFRQAAQIDPSCGIAYWGMSLANESLDPVRAKQFATEAARHKAGLSGRERAYIDALSRDTGYQAVIARYPDDLEAKAFEVWRLWNKRERGDREETTLKTARELIRDIFRVEPLHPIHHAMIHFADATNHLDHALDSAGKCGEAAPGIGHMWHMPVHVYYSQKDYIRSAWQLEASIRTENSHAIRDWAAPSHLYAHNNEWLIRTLLRLGRVHEACRVAMNMIDQPRAPPSGSSSNGGGTSTGSGDSSGDSKAERPSEAQLTGASYGNDRLVQVLSEFEFWDELGELRRSGYLASTGSEAEQIALHTSFGVVAYCRGDVAGGDEEAAALQKMLDEKLAPRPTQASSPDRDGSHNAVTISDLRRQLEILEKYRKVLTGIYVSRPKLIVSLLTLGVLDAAGIWLLRRRFLAAALVAILGVVAGAWIYQRHVALLDLPFDGEELDVAVVCQKLLEAGDPQEAVWCATNIVAERNGEVRPQANLVETLYKAGQTDRARVEFQKLRELAGAADLDSPPLARLAPIARDFGLPADWRLRDKIDHELAGLRPLDSLGPLLWAPPPAPDWTLKDADGKDHSLAELRGKPIVLLFFLGAGCSHCQQQLAAFVKEKARLAEAGFQVVAVSSDDAKGVRKLLSSYGPDPFPFLMLADPQLKVFEAYHAYDDFERIALHGTFFIDAQGRIRWINVGSEPFMDVPFAIREFERLASRPVDAN